eukprot:SAG31_NODE_9254_length_1308_cov_1.113317_2_plen_95_part_00
MNRAEHRQYYMMLAQPARSSVLEGEHAMATLADVKKRQRQRRRGHRAVQEQADRGRRLAKAGQRAHTSAEMLEVLFPREEHAATLHTSLSTLGI